MAISARFGSTGSIFHEIKLAAHFIFEQVLRNDAKLANLTRRFSFVI